MVLTIRGNVRLLFLDDDAERHRVVALQCGAHVTVEHVTTVDEAINALNQGSFDIVSLDHDLDDTDAANTGMAVAQYIALHLEPARRPPFVIVHSVNPDGARAMEATLTEAGIKTLRVAFGTNLRGLPLRFLAPTVQEQGA